MTFFHSTLPSGLRLLSSHEVPFPASKTEMKALAGVAQWIEHGPANQRVTGSIPSQGTCLGCRPSPQWGCVRSNHTLMFLALSFSFPSPTSENK